jgi:excisionase family DNA binding protein
MTTPLLTPDAVADELNLSTWYVCRLIRLGELHAMNVGVGKRPTYRITREALNKFLADRAVTT